MSVLRVYIYLPFLAPDIDNLEAKSRSRGEGGGECTGKDRTTSTVCSAPCKTKLRCTYFATKMTKRILP